METHIIKVLNEIKDLIIGKTSRWMSIKDVVQYTSMSESTIRRAVQKGELKASHATGKLLFKASDIERWLNG